jgi:hypothetical protein
LIGDGSRARLRIYSALRNRSTTLRFARTVRTTMTSAKLVEWIGNERPRLPLFRLRRSFAGVAGQRSRSLARVLARNANWSGRLDAASTFNFGSATSSASRRNSSLPIGRCSCRSRTSSMRRRSRSQSAAIRGARSGWLCRSIFAGHRRVGRGLRPRSRIAVLILPWRGRIRFERGGGGRRSRA